MEFILVSSSFSKICRGLEANKLFKMIKCKIIRIDSEDMRILAKKNRVTKLPVFIIKHGDTDTNRLQGCDNILKFIENFTKINTRVERLSYGVYFTTVLLEDLDEYDLVVI